VRTLLVGLDGVSRSVLRPLLESARLPNLQALFEDGVVGDLESQMPPWTPSAWPSLYTGVNPGKHGAFDFLAFDGYDWGLVNRTHVREHALWELLDRHGLSSVVVNVPVTNPPRPFDGALVPGYVAPESPTCHPEGLLADLREELGDYRVYAPRDAEGDDRAAWYRRLVEMRGEAFRHLVGEYDPDFGFLQFQQTDTVFHERPDDEAVVTDVFEAVDEEIGRTLDRWDPDTVVVASDHGIGPVEGYEFRVNEYLRDAGLLESTSGEGGMPSWTSLARERDDGDAGSPLARRLLRAAASVGLTSQRIHAVLSTLRLDGLVLRLVSTDTVRAATERVDFPESTAYMRSRTELGVRINKAGRDPDGGVSPIEYASVREDVIRELRAARTPDGDPVFEEVVPGEQYFSGPYTDDAVDVVTVPADFDHYLSASLRGDVFDEPTEPWNHKRTGLVALAGDGVDASDDELPDVDGLLVDAGVPRAHLFDVAPTVLSLLGVPPSDRMDGDPLGVVDAVAPQEYAPYTPDATHLTEDDDLEQRLANLGYLDDTDER
jgi:predicted AlkP superfamily phosphohydrolase/phosphomutase